MVKYMKRNCLSKLLSLSVLTLMLNACSYIPFIDTTSDYKKVGSSRPLEVPPDLTAVSSSQTYNVPGATSYSEYQQLQEGNEPGVEPVLKGVEGVRMEKAGRQRWLVVDAPAEQIWPAVREFWIDQGFAVRVENPQTGVIETEWIRSNKLKVDSDKQSFGKRFDKWLDDLSGFADRRKFRTRLERGEQEGTTEIYMTHRTVAGARDDGKQRIQTQLGEIETGYRVDAETNKNDIKRDEFDEDLDAELLRRLMVKLGVEENRASQIADNPVREKRAQVTKEDDQSVTLSLKDSYARGWRRVGLALDRIGFVVEDKDRSRGMYYVRYADVDLNDTPKKKGLLDVLAFWRDDDEMENKSRPKEETTVVDKLKFWKGKDETKDPTKKYNIKVTEVEGGTVVNVVDYEGNRDATTTANRIISLLYRQLK